MTFSGSSLHLSTIPTRTKRPPCSSISFDRRGWRRAIRTKGTNPQTNRLGTSGEKLYVTTRSRHQPVREETRGFRMHGLSWILQASYALPPAIKPTDDPSLNARFLDCFYKNILTKYMISGKPSRGKRQQPWIKRLIQGCRPPGCLVWFETVPLRSGVIAAAELSAGGGSRTHTGVPPQRILSPQRLPFRHAGWLVERSRHPPASRRHPLVASPRITWR